MNAYTDFARVYDIFMDTAPYEEWSRQIAAWIEEYGIAGEGGRMGERNVVVDLGCGTGTLTELLAGLGFDMIGIDSSPEMLNAAMAKRAVSRRDILYLQQDMRELELFGTAGTMISICDSLNYLLAEEEIKDTFCLVNNYLCPGGIFIFDFNTVTKYHQIGDTIIAENRDDCSFIWENYYHQEEQINEYDLTVFVKEQELYRRFQENHLQRGYSLQQMQALLVQAGLRFVAAFDGEDYGAVREDSERIYVIAEEQGKVRVKDGR